MNKNIYLLPTKKTSRLHFHTSLFISPNYQLSNTINSAVEGRNIYITNDENTKDGDWSYYENSESLKGIHKIVNGSRPKTMILKKIIATTDKDLINDGIQAINDEFLEWFVKNSSCEWVEVINELNINGKNGLDRARFVYKIIVPKEESKLETLEEAACIALGYEYDYWLKLHSKDQSSLIYIEVTSWCKGAKWHQEKLNKF